MTADNDNDLPHSRAEAKAIGATHYFTGKPCKRGHVAKRFTSYGTCIECSREKQREKYAADPVKACARVRKQYSENPEPRRASERKRRKEHPEKVKASTDKWRKANPAKRNKIARNAARRQRANNPEPERVRQRQWRLDNPEKVKETRRKSYQKRRKNPKFRLEEAIRSGVTKGLRKGAKASRRTFEILDYSLSELMTHLEKQFLPGMSWGNYGRNGWHVDHRVPLSAHNYQTPDDIDFKKAWSLSNLQPLWEPDNIRKSGKLATSFQPSLALAA